MCLEKPIKIKVNKNITCYKICRKYKNNTYSTCFQNFLLQLDTTYQITEKPKIYYTSNVTYNGKKIRVIDGNAFHSFKTLQGAKNCLKSLNPFNTTSFVIIKCVIPQNTEFLYEGVYYFDIKPYKAYASQSIKPLSVIKINFD